MKQLKNEIFVCLDFESTGLDVENDRIIEVAIVKFTLNEILEEYTTLIDPEISIPQNSIDIHNISQEMTSGKPKIKEILPKILSFIEGYILMGHGINFDIDLLKNESNRNLLVFDTNKVKYIDTLRLARLYGKSQINSLKHLSKHFNIEFDGAHRALNDVSANIEVFKKLILNYSKAEEILTRLQKPILLKQMPLGKHKNRPFAEIPIEYLKWASSKDFDIDLSYSIRHEINKRKNILSFERASNP